MVENYICNVLIVMDREDTQDEGTRTVYVQSLKTSVGKFWTFFALLRS